MDNYKYKSHQEPAHMCSQPVEKGCRKREQTLESEHELGNMSRGGAQVMVSIIFFGNLMSFHWLPLPHTSRNTSVYRNFKATKIAMFRKRHINIMSQCLVNALSPSMYFHKKRPPYHPTFCWLVVSTL